MISPYNEIRLPEPTAPLVAPVSGKDIQYALDRVQLTGGTVRLPAGEIAGLGLLVPYLEQPFPHIPLPHIHLQGAGIGVTRLFASELALYRSNFTVSDLSIEAGSVTIATEYNTVARNVTLRRVAILKSVGPGLLVSPSRIKGGDAAVILTTVEDCIFGEAAGANIVHLKPGTTTTRFVRTSFKEFEAGVLVEGAHQTVFEDCHWEGNRGRGPYLAAKDIRGLLVRRGWFEESHLAPNAESPWFVQLQSGYDAVIDARFVRKNPKGRFVCAGDIGPFYGCSIMGSGRIVGPWDGQPVVWVASDTTALNTGLAMEGDAGWISSGTKQFNRTV